MEHKVLKISRESVEKISPTKFKGNVEITDVEPLELGKSLPELIWEAQLEATKNNIRANTVVISKRLAKVNRFVQTFDLGISYKEFPPLICGLEAYITDEMPDELGFGLLEAPTTQREQVFEDGRKTGYKEGYEQGLKDLAERLKRFYQSLKGETFSSTVAYHIDQIKKDLLKGDEDNE